MEGIHPQHFRVYAYGLVLHIELRAWQCYFIIVIAFRYACIIVAALTLAYFCFCCRQANSRGRNARTGAVLLLDT